MEKELNIAAILKDKPVGTKLWSPIFGNCVFSRLSGSGIRVFPIHNGFTSTEEKSFFVTGQYTLAGEVCLFPSKQMQDWSKFAWEKGDVLQSRSGYTMIFFDWFSDDYTKFNGSYAYSIEGFNDVANQPTSNFRKVSDEEAKEFIKKVEEHYGGKLNLETLEIEKQTEFKDGDIVFVGSYMLGINTSSMIAIFRKEKEIDKYKFSPALCESNEHDTYFREDPVVLSPSEIMTFRPANDSEKQKLFDALAKEGKRWNPNTKQIEDLPKKCEFKPMDWCLMKDSTKYWELCQFAYTKKVHGTTIYSAVGGLIFYKCIPYNEETAHLLGTTDDWKGGEG